MSHKLVGGGSLLALASFMLLGFTQAGVDAGSASTLAALLVTVGLPGVAGAGLLRSHFRRPSLRAGVREQLRRETLESEVLRLAGLRQGKLVAIEVAEHLALPAEEAKAVLDSLVGREVADLEVSDSGILVYTFHDIRHLAEKSTARPVLDA